MARKVDTTTFNDTLAQKVNSATFNNALAQKVNTTTFTRALAQKVNTKTFNTAMALKVDTETFAQFSTVTNSELSTLRENSDLLTQNISVLETSVTRIGNNTLATRVDLSTTTIFVR